MNSIFSSNSKKNILAFVAVFSIMLTMFFSSLYIISEQNHDCCDNQCPICQEIHICESLLTELGGLLVFAACLFIVFSRDNLTGFVRSAAQIISSPVSLKVRMNN